MVLEQHSDVKWFTPAKAKAPRGSSRAASPRRPQRWHQHDQVQAQAPVALAVTSKPVTQHVPAPVSAPDSTTAVDPWSVYGPAFERVASRGGRSSNRRLGKEVLRNVPPTCLSPQDSDASTGGWRRIHSQQPQRLGYPSDSAVSAPGVQRNTAGLPFTDLDTTSDLEVGSGSDLSYDDELLTLDDAANARSVFTQEQDICFADMPLELLNHIFLDFMCISSDSLHRLAQERSEARTKASQQASATAALTASSGGLCNSRGGAEPARGSNWQPTNSTHNCQQLLRDGHNIRSPPYHHHHPHHHQRLRHAHHHHRHRHTYPEHHSEQGLFQELQSASQASSSSSSSSASSSFSSQLGANSLFSETASNLFLVTDQDPSYDGEEEEEDNENDTESDTSDAQSLDESNVATPDFAEDESDSDEGISSEDGDVDPMEESGDSGSHDIDFAYRNDTATQSATSSSHLTSITSSSSSSEDDEDPVDHAYALDPATDTENSVSSRSTVATATASSSSSLHPGKSGKRYYRHRRTGARQCCCQRALMDSAEFMPKPRMGINRVDNDLEEDKMLYQLHRDQYFHPTTHTSLRSELYTCSLVNRQWRIAALQLLWQSVVLDSESCRPEPSDPCACCSRPRSSLKGLSSHQADAAMSLPSPPQSESSSSSSSSSFSTRIVRTRLEAMLDSYLDLYGLDLAKCVQTVELDLRLLVWSAEGESVKRILRRLSPFTHLRLVWAGKESPEEMMTGFKVAMDSLHSQIRHLHFFSGFVISPAWTREMAKMTRLHTVTIESLGSLDAIEFDWTRLKCLKLNSVIPRSVFRWPSSPLTAPQPLYTLSEGAVNGGHHHSVMLHHAGALLTAGMNAQTGVGMATVAHADLNTVNPGNAWISTQNTGTNGWSGSQQQLLPPLLPGSDATGLISNATSTTQLHASATAMHHPERLRSIGSGWWQWTGLRRLDLQLRNTVLPKEWLQDLTTAIAQNSAMLMKQEQYLYQQRLVTGKQALLPSGHQYFSALDYEQESISSYGPPLEVLNIDCEVSHQHKDIFMDLVRVWGHRMEEFHFSHSGELTDEFLWLCLVRMTRLKKLSLRDSKGITGEGVSRRQTVDSAESESPLNASNVDGALALQGSPSSGHADNNGVLGTEQSERAPSRKPVKVPIRWRRDFKELNLDKSRVRREFLQTLRQRCPGVVYKVREVRQKTS